ncbi:phosphoglycolate phosphatase [Aliiruegeria haliotis]|uniref:Phosphoglycolate phosphatase n=1 Tax=Aliiruegeria haliotis TaxID=1280846 RepID=A0A2T0RW38_9RHOB|nr:phosphoglycolate phosphatase [Aliiruegeria haliotis]PRY25391.1 phosphoglycolate phosphatase [Aliiruegeria haliotis]
MNIVFDLDGTLIDSAPDIQAVAADILNGLGKAPLSLEEVRSFVGEGAGVLVSRMMNAREIPETPARHAEIYGQFVARYESAVDLAVFYPGVVDALAVLKAQGHRLGLCTNKPELPARAVMRHMGLDPVFDVVIAGGMVASRKPDPEMLHVCIAELGGGPTLYVGDSETDAQTARAAAVPFALYTEGYRKSPVAEMPHDWAFDHFDRLQEIVREARARQTAAE